MTDRQALSHVNVRHLDQFLFVNTQDNPKLETKLLEIDMALPGLIEFGTIDGGVLGGKRRAARLTGAGRDYLLQLEQAGTP